MSVLNFKLALNGQIYNGEGLLYTFPENITNLRMSGQYPAWINALPLDSRFVRELIIGGGECFSVRYGKEGLFYSYTRYNPHDARNGAVMVALHTENKAFQDAKQLTIALRNLMDYFLEKNSSAEIQDKEVQELTQDLLTPYCVELPEQESPLTKDAYRIYHSEEDLYKYLNWAIQKEYTQYKWVHFILGDHKKVSINPDSYVELSSPIAKCYPIKCLNNQIDLRLSRSTYVITYKKEGFLAKEVSFQVGQPSSFIEMDSMDDTIRIKSEDELKIKFKKKVIVELLDFETGHKIMDGDKPYCEEFEIEEGQHSQKINLYAPGYKSKSMTVELNTLKRAESIIQCHMQKEPSKRIHDEEKNGNKKGIIQVRKKPFLILTLILWLITISVGGGVGFYVNGLIQSKGVAEQIEKIEQKRDAIQGKLNEANDSIQTLQDSITQQKMTIQDLNSQIKKLQTNTPNTQGSNTSTTSKVEKLQQAEQAALDYLNTSNEWSLLGMKKHENSKYIKIIEKTNAHTYLEIVVNHDKLDNSQLDILLKNELRITNKEWLTIINLIKTKKQQNVRPDKIVQAFKEVNKGGQTPRDGSVELNALKNKIIPLKK